MDIAGWDKMYGSGERGSEDAPAILLEEVAGTIAQGRAVDLACGTGRNALYLAALGWDVRAVDGSAHAIATLQERAKERGLATDAVVADLADSEFVLAEDVFDLVVVAYYLQRDLFGKVKAAVRPGGVVIAIVHIPAEDEEWTEKRAARGELRGFFQGWEILWDYEGASRDPAHKRPVAEIAARRPA